jgi:L-threonylcarbamoyladenylate synthase
MQDFINKAVQIIQSGGVVCLPTDTQFGLSVDSTNDLAIQKLINLKSRSQNAGIPLLLGSIDQLQLVTDTPPGDVMKLFKHFWPGALTVIMPKNKSVLDFVSGGHSGVAVRIPNHEIPRLIASRLGRPITGTSANFSGDFPVRNVNEANKTFGSIIDFVFPTSENIIQSEPSTIVEYKDNKLSLIRKGAISFTLIEKVYNQSR